MKIKGLLVKTSAIFLIISLTIGCVEENQNNNDKDKPEVLLTVQFNDYLANYTLENLEEFDSFSGTGRYVKTKTLPETVIISDSHEYTGVKITTFIDEISSLPEKYNISVISSDGWIVNFTMNQTLGYVDVYNESGSIIENETAEMILAFKEDDKYYSEMDSEENDGPLRIAFVGDDVITSSNLWSKMVVSIDIISLE